MVAGKTCISGGMVNRPMSRLRLAWELGMNVIYLPASDVGACTDMEVSSKHLDSEYYLDYGFNPVVFRIREGIHRDISMMRVPLVMEKLGLDEDDVIYTYPDWPGYTRAGRFDPSNVAHFSSATQIRRIANYPSRGVGFGGAAGACMEIMEAIKAAKRKRDATLFGKIYGSSFENFSEEKDAKIK